MVRSLLSGAAGYVVHDVFAHLLGAAVGRRRRLGGRGLRHGQRVGDAIHGARRRKHQALHAKLPHHLQQRQQRAHVVLEVGQRLFHRLAHRLIGREVNHALYGLFRLRTPGATPRQSPQSMRCTGTLRAQNSLDARQRRLARIAEIINDNRLDSQPAPAQPPCGSQCSRPRR